jgi:hypothetical protein
MYTPAYPKSTYKRQREKVQKIKLQDTKECYVTGRTDGLHKHHIFEGVHRKSSEKYGLCVYLRPEWHNMSDNGVHFNKALDLELKQYAQTEFEKVYSREEFIHTFGRSYL